MSTRAREGRSLVSTAVLAALCCGACTSDEKVQTGYLGLEQPSHGFQVRSLGAEIGPGEDVEYCEIAELPGDPGQTYYVRSIELANAPSSHHMFVSTAVPGSAADERLRKMNVGDRIPCFSAATAFPERGLETTHGIQLPYGRLDFPEGVGREFFGGQRVVFDYHYLNTGNEPIAARSAFNFHLTDASRVEHVARVFGFYNWTIDTPPGATSQFTAECRFRDDVKLAGLTRHTHRWGTNFDVWYAGTRNDEHLWTTNDWEHDTELLFPEPLLMKAGEGFRFRCGFNNTENHPLRFGPSARDEMCILFGLAWDAGTSRTVAPQGCDITWIDEEGVGHPTNVGEGFPPPTAGEAALCRAGSVSEPGAPLDECSECRCSACANIIIQCVADEACLPILQCVQRTRCGDECANACQAEIDANASAVGLITRVASCIDNECPSCSIQGEAD